MVQSNFRGDSLEAKFWSADQNRGGAERYFARTLEDYYIWDHRCLAWAFF